MDDLRRDDVRSARETSPSEKLSQAINVTAYGLALKRRNLQRAMPNASPSDIDKAFEDWLFERG